MSKKKYYAVRKGHNIGIYMTWDECKAQVNGFSGAEYKSFTNLEDAHEYMNVQKKKIDTSLMAYVDGSFNKETSTSGYGLALVVDNEIIYCDKKSFPGHPYNSHRNVFGEIKGAEAAILTAIEKGYKSVCIAYDYEGIEHWATGNWKTNYDLTREYRANFIEYSKQIDISFKKIKAHASEENGGDKFNDFVDTLAKASVGI